MKNKPAIDIRLTKKMKDAWRACPKQKLDDNGGSFRIYSLGVADDFYFNIKKTKYNNKQVEFETSFTIDGKTKTLRKYTRLDSAKRGVKRFIKFIYLGSFAGLF